MINKRESIFETNSSSMHSIVVSKENRGYDYNLPLSEDGVLYVKFGEFGWGPDILKTPIDKISYYLTDNSGLTYSDISWEDGVKEIMEKQEVKNLINILKSKVPGFKELRLKPSNECYRFGYVDHESSGLTYGEDVEDLIFNKSKIIIIDNDNSCHFEEYHEPEPWEKGGHPHKDIEELFI